VHEGAHVRGVQAIYLALPGAQSILHVIGKGAGRVFLQPGYAGISRAAVKKGDFVPAHRLGNVFIAKGQADRPAFCPPVLLAGKPAVDPRPQGADFLAIRLLP